MGVGTVHGNVHHGQVRILYLAFRAFSGDKVCIATLALLVFFFPSLSGESGFCGLYPTPILLGREWAEEKHFAFLVAW